MADQSRNLEIVLKAKDQVSKVTSKVSASMVKMKERSKKAFKAIGGFAKRTGGIIKKMLGPITLVTGALTALSGGGLFALVKSAAKSIDTIGKFSERLGLSTEFLSEMAHVADLSGVKIEALNVGFQRATRRFAEFASTGGGAAAQAIKDLGIEDLIQSGKTLEEILPQISDGFVGLGTDAERVKAAFGLFDSEGVSFLQFLNKGSTGIAEMRAEAQKLGIVIGEDAAAGAAKFNDDMSRMTAAFKGLKFSLGVAFFEDMAGAMVKISKWVAENREKIVEFVKKVAEVGTTLIRSISAAFGSKKGRESLADFIVTSFNAIFEAAGKSAALGFAGVFGFNLENEMNKIIAGLLSLISKVPFIGGAQMSRDAKRIRGRVREFEGQSEQDRIKSQVDLWILAAHNIGLAHDKLKATLPVYEQTDKAVNKIKTSFGLPTESGVGGGSSDKRGFFGTIADGFQEQAAKMKETFLDVAGNAAQFATDAHSALSTNFFDLAKRQFTDFKTFVVDTFTSIVDSILSIISDALASQVVSGFGGLLGLLFPKDQGGSPLSGGLLDLFTDQAPGGGVQFGPPLPPGYTSGGGGYGSSKSSIGNTSSGGTTIINISAIDGASVARMVQQHGGTLVQGIANAAASNQGSRSALQGAIA